MKRSEATMLSELVSSLGYRTVDSSDLEEIPPSDQDLR
jgi:hypothetical protein